MAESDWETSIVCRDGLADVYLRNCGRTITIQFSSPDLGFTVHSLFDQPIVRIAAPELIPGVVGALRSLLGALESL